MRPGDALPTQAVLMREFGASSLTGASQGADPLRASRRLTEGGG
ncbi:hypothetical protein AB0D35_07845 [Streptomyces sp. NPDC048301]